MQGRWQKNWRLMTGPFSKFKVVSPCRRMIWMIRKGVSDAMIISKDESQASETENEFLDIEPNAAHRFSYDCQGIIMKWRGENRWP